ncbi:MAG: segregation/condensation protein A [Ruminococcus sp.]|nr:segregation/condensation protein A [Ruminococcus sp.]
MAVEFKLDAFQGPLDLLLHLISKHKLNIYDIEISLLLEQYLDYMNQLDEQDYESAGEFLQMAARLIYIKTASLLPQPEEAQELKKDLEGRIIEYSLCKKAAEMLKNMYAGDLVYVRAPVPVIVDKTYTRLHEPQDIYNAYMGISAKNRNRKPLRADMFSPIVSHKIVSVTSKIIFVLKKLYKHGVFEMDKLYENVTSKSEKVATFLAVLELTKSGRIYINDDNTELRFIRNSGKQSERTVEDEKNSINETSDYSVFEENLDAGIADNVQNNDENEVIADNGFQEIANNDIDKAEIKPVVKSISERVYQSHVISCTDTAVEDETLELCDNELGEETAEDYIESSELNEPPVTIFKPNYWNMRKYYWGYSYVGDDSRNNFWCYG